MLCGSMGRDASPGSGSFDFAQDLVCGARTSAKRLNFDSALQSGREGNLFVALRSGLGRLECICVEAIAPLAWQDRSCPATSR